MDFFIFVLCLISLGLAGYGLFLLLTKPDDKE